jgi:ParB family transcriptional regulator, chromosome partitioning protein
VRPRATTLKFRTGAVRPQEAVSAADQRQVNLEARRALHPMKVAWLAVADIDEMPPELNSRQTYDEASINELAASVAEHGILQPLCVRPSGHRYLLVYGMRRLKAAMRAGLHEVPCTIQVADDDRAFLLNTVENLHRRQLSGAERVRAIERLAATDLEVREISWRTGFAHTTISRWLKIDRRPLLKEALESEALDIGRAMALADAPDDAVPMLLAHAPTLRQEELKARVV